MVPYNFLFKNAKKYVLNNKNYNAANVTLLATFNFKNSITTSNDFYVVTVINKIHFCPHYIPK